MHSGRLQNALKNLSEAIREVEAAAQEMRAGHDRLAVHIFVSRRQYRTMPDKDTKSGKRREMAARVSWQTARELGFHGTIGGGGAPRSDVD
jgi:hypothetical protein